MPEAYRGQAELGNDGGDTRVGIICLMVSDAVAGPTEAERLAEFEAARDQGFRQPNEYRVLEAMRQVRGAECEDPAL